MEATRLRAFDPWRSAVSMEVRSEDLASPCLAPLSPARHLEVPGNGQPARSGVTCPTHSLQPWGDEAERLQLRFLSWWALMAPSRPCAFARCNFPHVTMDDLPPSPYRRAPSKSRRISLGFDPRRALRWCLPGH